MAPATKKRKTNKGETFPCFSCGTERSSAQFPDYNPSPDCDHLINTCKTCLKKWITAKVDDASFATGGEDGKVFGIKCPQCDGVMRNVNIEMAAAKKVHERFEELERKYIGETTPGWRWCLSPFCRAGQVHESKPSGGPRQSKRQKKSKKAEPLSVDEPDICTCHECGAKACVKCDRPWHESETCAEYQARIKDRVDEEDKSLKQIQVKTKGCPNPNCGKRIEKNGGCPMVHCIACHSYFCWNCVEVLINGMCACNRRAPQPPQPPQPDHNQPQYNQTTWLQQTL